MKSLVILWCLAGMMYLGGGRLTAADWKIDIVDRDGVGTYTSLKLDKSGNMHLAYIIQDGNHYPLKYAFWDHLVKKWFVMNVAKAASFCSLAVDSENRPHISYADFGTGKESKVRYAHWDGTTWKVEPIRTNSEIIGYYTSIALDRQDHPHICFYELAGPAETNFKRRLRNVAWNGRYWELKTVDAEDGSGKFNSMVSDPLGILHLVYANVSEGTQAMHYASWDGKWNLQLVDGRANNNGESVGYSAAIAVEANGTPHVTYMNETSDLLKYAVRKNGRWEPQVVSRVTKIGYPDRNSIALDDAGRPYIGYYDAGRGTLNIAYREGDSWVTEVVDSNLSGYTSSLQFQDGTLWLSYGDQSNRVLKVAHSEVGRHSRSGSSERKSNTAPAEAHRQ